jgi:quercetin dioxygenase-like cupin family protein
MTTTEGSPQAPARTVLLDPQGGERFDIIGGGVRMLLDGASSGGRCTVFEGPIPPGDGPPLHSHEREDELFYVLDGTFKFALDGRVLVAQRGSFVCAPRRSVHAFRNIGPATGTLLITCTPAGIEVPFRAIRMPGPGSRSTPPTMDRVIAELGRHGITFHGPPLGDD